MQGFVPISHVGRYRLVDDRVGLPETYDCAQFGDLRQRRLNEPPSVDTVVEVIEISVIGHSREDQLDAVLTCNLDKLARQIEASLVEDGILGTGVGRPNANREAGEAELCVAQPEWLEDITARLDLKPLRAALHVVRQRHHSRP